jgi:hypothetical protein
MNVFAGVSSSGPMPSSNRSTLELLEPVSIGVTAFEQAEIVFDFEYDFFLNTQSFLPQFSFAFLEYELIGRCIGCTHASAPSNFVFLQDLNSGHGAGVGDSDDRTFAFGDFRISGWLNPGERYEVQLTRLFMTARAAVVPEPATWAMLIAGFGLVGGALRRRRALEA